MEVATIAAMISVAKCHNVALCRNAIMRQNHGPPPFLHPAPHGTLNHAGHGLIGMTLFQERHRFGAARFQLLGGTFGPPASNQTLAQQIVALFIRVSTTELAES